MYEIGLITTTHGIRGEVKVRDLSDFDRFKKGAKVFVIYNNERINLTIENVRTQKDNLIVKFQEYNNINEVLNYRGLAIYSDTRAKLKKNEFYIEDLFNLKVYDTSNNYIGIVDDIMELPHGKIMVVVNETNKTRKLIPFVSEFIKEVDLEQEIIKVEVIEGLIW